MGGELDMDGSADERRSVRARGSRSVLECARASAAFERGLCIESGAAKAGAALHDASRHRLPFCITSFMAARRFHPPTEISCAPNNGCRACSAFTLLEIMVVLVLIGILTALILPEMRGTYEDALLRSTSRQLVNAFNLAYSR